MTSDELWQDQIAAMRRRCAGTFHERAHARMLEDLDTARTQYLHTRNDRVLLRLNRIERKLLGPCIEPRDDAERARLRQIGVLD